MKEPTKMIKFINVFFIESFFFCKAKTSKCMQLLPDFKFFIVKLPEKFRIRDNIFFYRCKHFKNIFFQFVQFSE